MWLLCEVSCLHIEASGHFDPLRDVSDHKNKGAFKINKKSCYQKQKDTQCAASAASISSVSQQSDGGSVTASAREK